MCHRTQPFRLSQLVHPTRRTTACAVLGHHDRFLRRKRLTTAGGEAFLVDLTETVNHMASDAFDLNGGHLVEIAAAEEEVPAIRGGRTRLAGHIGNRHTPCQILADRPVIRTDHVFAAMLRGLCTQVTTARRPFPPEGGAYGMGRRMGHAH